VSTQKVLDYPLGAVAGVLGSAVTYPQPVKQDTPVVFEFSDNLVLRQNYFALRQECYREDLGLKDFSGGWDAHDVAGNVLIARKGNEVVGGARIVVSSPASEQLLPLESKDFRMSEIFPELHLEKAAYCEFSRLAVERSERTGGNLARDIIIELTREAKARGIRYLFAVSTPLQARCYRKVFKSLGHDYVIDTSVEVPQKEIYGHLKMVIAYCDFESFV
jgi:hypothetical protein